MEKFETAENEETKYNYIRLLIVGIPCTLLVISIIGFLIAPNDTKPTLLTLFLINTILAFVFWNLIPIGYRIVKPKSVEIHEFSSFFIIIADKIFGVIPHSINTNNDFCRFSFKPISNLSTSIRKSIRSNRIENEEKRCAILNKSFIDKHVRIKYEYNIRNNRITCKLLYLTTDKFILGKREYINEKTHTINWVRKVSDLYRNNYSHYP